LTAERAPSFSTKVPEGDTRPRRVCDTCGFVDYVNPRVVVGVVAVRDGKVLLCRRAIDPRKGLWTLPAGFMEERESVEEGARREAREEAGADVDLEGVLGIYSVPRISQVHVYFRARLLPGELVAGEESLEARLFAWEELPWDELAFPSVQWALDHYRETRDSAAFPARSNPPGERGDYRS
jgi:ADP-ribose pyrophosphatase YjhB (NUDIX family)